MSSTHFGESILNRNCTDVITKVFLADGSPPKELPQAAKLERSASSVSSSMAMERSPKMRMANLNLQQKSNDYLDKSMDIHSHVRKSTNIDLTK